LHIDNILYKKVLTRGTNGDIVEKIEVKISDFGISKVLQKGMEEKGKRGGRREWKG
jgi:hypothetical protein